MIEELNYVAIVAAAAAAVVVSFGYYIVFGNRLQALGGAVADVESPPAWMLPAELLRGLVAAAVVAGLAAGMGLKAWGSSLTLAVALWIGFPVVLLSGSVIHEHVPWMLATIHAGDWLLKLLVIAAIVTLWS